jgi:hypothetical protein
MIPRSRYYHIKSLLDLSNSFIDKRQVSLAPHRQRLRCWLAKAVPELWVRQPAGILDAISALAESPRLQNANDTIITYGPKH